MNTINITKKEGYAIVQLKSGKVNAINHEMVNELSTAFDELENDTEIRGVILTGIPHFFSAGLNVIELFGYDQKKMRQFMHDFGALHVQMVWFSKPLVCAINGHSPAGGTVLAITADYRIMAEGEKYSIGLNEVAVSVQISNNLVAGYSFWLGQHLAHKYIMAGKLLNCKEALEAGLIDELQTQENLLPRAEKVMQNYLLAHPKILKNTKNKVRKTWLEQLGKYNEEDLEQSLDVWWDPEIRARMQALINRISKR